MAHTKSAGTTKNGRDSQPKYLGVKKYAGEQVRNGHILIRQRGAKFLAGTGVRCGNDYTLYAVQDGVVRYETKKKERFDGSVRYAKIVAVIAS